MRLPIAAAALLAATAALAQNSGPVQSTPPPSGVIPERIEQRPPAETQARAGGSGLPEACRRAAALAGYVDMPMDGGLPQPMTEAMQRMTGTQRAMMQAMTRMHAAMMQGMTAKDADIAWVCAMIPHHQGAIEMARAGLQGADNAESRRMAEETIRMQDAEIAKLTRWVEANVERESANESGAQPRR